MDATVAHTSPLRFTIDAYVLVPSNRPPTVPPSPGVSNPGAAISLSLSVFTSGSSLQFAGAAYTLTPIEITSRHKRAIFLIIVVPRCLQFEEEAGTAASCQLRSQ